MQRLQLALTAALVVLLSFIAYDLHRLASSFHVSPAEARAAAAILNPPPETPAQRKARIEAEARQTLEDGETRMRVFLNPDGNNPKRRPTTAR